ncbi:hypothetical protein M8J76_014842 [Diaphorina citri]|nr:hypothetical protein M8J76_014842 [Diaphorina citri]
MLEEKLQESEAKHSVLQTIIDQDQEALEDIQQRSRNMNIVIRGIKEEKTEDVGDVVMHIGRQLGIDNPENDVQICYRVPSRNKDSPRPIVVKLLNSKTRDIWIKKYKSKELWKKKMYITEHLTPYNQNLFYHTRKLAKESGYKFAWTKDGKIYLKENEDSGVLNIKNMNDHDPIIIINTKSLFLGLLNE